LQSTVGQLKKAEDSLKVALIVQEAILDNIPDMAWLKDTEGKFLAVNGAFERTSGLSRKVLIGKTDFDFWPETLARRFREDDLEVMRSGEQKRIEETTVREGESPTWIETIKSPVHDDKGNLIGITGISRDVTERKVTKDRLEKALAEADRLLEEAAKYVSTLLPEPVTNGEISATWRFQPSTALGGDLFGYHWLDDDHFAIYLVDVCGHGVGAALLSVTVTNVLRSKTLKDADFTQPGMVLSALNNAFPMERHNGMYFTMWYGVYNKKTRNLIYAGGGHPPGLLVNGLCADAPQLIQLHTPNLFIGGMEGLAFEQCSITLDSPARLYIFSDGVFEIESEDGAMWGLGGLQELLAAMIGGNQTVLDGVLKHVLLLNPSESLDDDLSIIEVLFH
jgi:PAS domain S-box-containing protein